MFPRAAVAVSAGADFVVEGAVDFVLLGAENGGEVAIDLSQFVEICEVHGDLLGHGEDSRRSRFFCEG